MPTTHPVRGISAAKIKSCIAIAVPTIIHGVHTLKLRKLSQKSRPFRTRYQEIHYLCARQGHKLLS